MIPPIRGIANRPIKTYSAMKKITNQTSCDANVSLLNGGNGIFPPPGCSVCAFVAIVRPVLRLECEQQQERDQQRKDAKRFGHGEPEDQVAELALGRRRIAQRRGKIVAEDDAHAGAGAAHADAGNAGTDVLRGHWIHEKTPFLGWIGLWVSDPDEWRR